MTDTGVEEVDIETTQVAGVELPVTYNCTKFHEDNPDSAQEYEINFFYDLLYGRSEPEEFAVGIVEAGLLDEVDAVYQVSTGTSCGTPFGGKPTLDTVWAVAISSLPPDTPNDSFDPTAPCLALVADETQSCVTMAGKITMSIVGQENESEVIEHIKVIMNSGMLTKGTTSQVRFLGTMIDDQVFGGKDKLPPPVTPAEETQKPKKKDEKVTPEGVLFVMGLIAAFVALVVVLVWRYKRRKQEKIIAVGEAVLHAQASKHVGDDLEESATQGYSVNTEDPPVMAAKRYDMNDPDQNLPEVPDDFPNTFSFEMGDIQRNELLGVHGNGVVTGTGREGGETSDSDADSWAQTDASLGSIELRLEPITAEV